MNVRHTRLEFARNLADAVNGRNIAADQSCTASPTTTEAESESESTVVKSEWCKTRVQGSSDVLSMHANDSHVYYTQSRIKDANFITALYTVQSGLSMSDPPVCLSVRLSNA